MIEILLSTGQKAKELIFLGSVPASNFITGAALATDAQFTVGTLINSTTDWLKFDDRGIIKLIPKLPIRHSVNYQAFVNALVQNGEKTVQIGNKFYALRLMTGLDLVYSEWDRLINSITSDRVARYTGPVLANFPRSELGMSDTDLGRYTFCYSTSSSVPRRIAAQDTLALIDRNVVYNYHGWRPLLQELPDLEFLGEVSATEFITGSALATLGGLSSGTIINNDQGWLHFKDVDGKEKYIAKRQFRYNVSRGQIAAAGLLNGKIVTVNGVNFICRCPGGANTAPTGLPDGTTYDNIFVKLSEWNRLMYAVSASRPSTYNGPVLANFSNTEMGYDQTNGYLNSCIGDSSVISTNGTFRGAIDVTYAHSGGNASVLANRGWRPILEKV